MTITSPRLITLTMPASDARNLSRFYDAVLSVNFGRTINDPATTVANSAFQTWASAGVKWNISNRYSTSERTMAHFAVPDLAKYRTTVQASGGKIVSEPIELEYHGEFIPHYKEKFAQFKFGNASDVTATLGTMQLFSDPDNNIFGLIQLAPWAEKLFENGEISKLEIAEQQASQGHAREYEEKGYHLAK